MPIVGSICLLILYILFGLLQESNLPIPLISFLSILFGTGVVIRPQKSISGFIKGILDRYNETHEKGIINQVKEVFNDTVDKFFLNNPDKTEKEGIQKIPLHKIKVVIMIDELDRCPLDKIVDILEAIKIFLVKELFIILMAVDTRVISEAITVHYKDVKNQKLANEYIEKIIQIPIPVPKAEKTDIEKFVKSYMNIREKDIKTTLLVEKTEPKPESQKSQPPQINRNLKISNDYLITPLQIPDTEVEWTEISGFTYKYLNSNPRRIKRLLKTYRYIKILASRLGEPVENESWQKKMINWLGMIMRWPEFTKQLLNMNIATLGKRNYKKIITQVSNESKEFPEFSFFNKTKLNQHELQFFIDNACNFLIEN